MTSKNPIVKNYAGGLPAPRAFYRLRPYTCAMHRQCRQSDKDKEKIIVASIGGISRAAGSTASRLRLPEEAEALGQVDSDGRAYGRYRVDVPGKPGQREVRVALGFCRDRISAMLKLQNAMSDAGVLDAAKLRERISSTATFAQQAQWMIAEMKAGRIVNGKTREPSGDRTIDFYSTAIAYLNEVLGEKKVVRSAVDDNGNQVHPKGAYADSRGAGAETQYHSGAALAVRARVVRSAVDDNGNQVHPRNWNLAFIGLPTVDKKKQHRPTLTREEMTQLVANTAGRYQMGAALLAGSSLRISELLALRIEKHISNDRKTLYIRQQRKKDGSGVTDVLKTPQLAVISTCILPSRRCSTTSLVAETVDSSSRPRTARCCLRRTSSGVASSPYSRKWGEQACASMHPATSVKRCCKKARVGNSSSITGWAMRTTR